MSATMLTTLLAVAAQVGATQTPSRPQAPEPLTFPSDVRMIRLDVSVVDGSGRPVRGLLPRDFSILEDGKPVELSVFEAVEDGSPATSVASEEGPRLSLAVRAENQPGRDLRQRIILVVDPSSLTPTQVARVRVALSDFILNSTRDQDLVRLINLATREVWEGLIPYDRVRLASLGRKTSRHKNPLFKPGGDGDSIAEQIDLNMEEDISESFSRSTRSERFLTQFARTGSFSACSTKSSSSWPRRRAGSR